MTEDTDGFRDELEERIRHIKQQRDDLYTQLYELNHQFNALEKRLQTAVEMFRLEFGTDPESMPTEAETRRSNDPQPRQRRNRRASGGSTWNEATTEVLADADGPLHVTEIWQKLRDSGFESEARDPMRALVSVLVRHPDVAHVGPNTFVLKSALGRQETLDGIVTDNPAHEGEAA